LRTSLPLPRAPARTSRCGSSCCEVRTIISCDDLHSLTSKWCSRSPQGQTLTPIQLRQNVILLLFNLDEQNSFNYFKC
jgi:hypothetical protein